MKRLVRALVDCQPEEVRPIILLFLHSCFSGLAYLSYSTAANALFLTQFDAQSLSYVYMGGTVMCMLFAVIYEKLHARIPFSKLVLFSIGSLSLFCVLLRAGLFFTDSKYLVLLIRMCFEPFFLVVSLVYWGVASLLFNIQQGKRLFGVISTGEVLSAIVLGLCIPAITRHIAVHDLLIMAAVFYGCCVVVLSFIVREYRAVFSESGHAGEHASHDRLSLRTVLSNRYMALIVIFCACVNAGWIFADFSFFDVVSARYKTENEVAAFMGVFNSTWNVLLLVMRSYLAAWLLKNMGVKSGLIAMPLILSVPVAIAALMGFSGHGVESIFWIILFGKLSTEVLQNSMSDTSMRILYQNLPGKQRISLQTIVEGLVMPFSFGLVGAFLLVAGKVTHFTAIQAVYVLVPLVTVWLTVSIVLHRTYGETLKKALARRSLTSAGTDLDDELSNSLVSKYLSSANAAEVLYALNLMDRQLDSIKASMLDQLLAHTSSDVRIETIRYIERRKLRPLRDRVESMFRTEENPRVLGQALRAVPALEDYTDMDAIGAYLQAGSPDVRRGAMCGLLCHCGLEGVLYAGPLLMDWVRSERSDERCLAAAVLGDVGVKTFHQPLSALLIDRDPAVRNAALRAAAMIGHPALLPGIYSNLTYPAMGQAACLAFAAAGKPAVVFLDAAYDRNETTRAQRIWILKALRRIGGEVAVDAIKKRLDDSAGTLRREAATGLVHLSYIAEPSERDRITVLIERECTHAAHCLAMLDDLETVKCHPVLLSALEIEVKRAIDGIFLLLSLLYTDRSVRDARLHLQARGQKRSLALELIDQTLSRDLKALVFPLIEDLTRGERRERLHELLPVESRTAQEHLGRILAADSRFSSWTQACAFYWIGMRGELAPQETIPQYAGSEVLIRETFGWAQERFSSQTGPQLQPQPVGEAL